MNKWTVRQYQRGLLYERGRFVELLEPGRYAYWWWRRRQIQVIDIRETSQTIEA